MAALVTDEGDWLTNEWRSLRGSQARYWQPLPPLPPAASPPEKITRYLATKGGKFDEVSRTQAMLAAEEPDGR